MINKRDNSNLATTVDQQITGDGLDKGMSLFYLLCMLPEGRALIFSHPDVFLNKLGKGDSELKDQSKQDTSRETPHVPSEARDLPAVARSLT